MELREQFNFYNAIKLLVKVLNNIHEDSFKEKIEALIEEYNSAVDDCEIIRLSYQDEIYWIEEMEEI